MNLFFMDGSALAKRYVAETGTPLVDHLFAHVPPDRMVVLNIGFAEVVSILVRRKNAGLISTTSFKQALLHLGQEIVNATNLRKIEATNALVISALSYIQSHSINSTDAIALHAALGLAQFLRAQGDDLVMFTSDLRFFRAAVAEGLIAFNPETQDQPTLATLM